MNLRERTLWTAGIVVLSSALVGVTLARGYWLALLVSSLLLVEALVIHLRPLTRRARPLRQPLRDVPCAHNERWQDCAGECWREKAEGWAP